MKHLLIKTVLALAAVAMLAGLFLLRSDLRFPDRIDDAEGAPRSVVAYISTIHGSTLKYLAIRFFR